ncbi:MAG: hypothetical protein QM718_06185 [Steroidobacteraceae bacterium]
MNSSSYAFATPGKPAPAFAAATRRPLNWLVYYYVLMLLSCGVLERFGLSVLAAYSLNAALIAAYGFLILGMLSLKLRLVPTRLGACCLCLAAAMASLVFNRNAIGYDNTSTSSVLLLAAIYLPFIFRLAPAERALLNPQRVMEIFANITLLCAIAGIVQFALQFAMRPPWLFDYTYLVPEILRGPTGFNTVIPVGKLIKSNGFFFREPSGFSFMMAFGFLIEMNLGKRLWRLALLALGLMLSYSGTGILALILGMLFPLNLKTVLRMMALAAGGLLVYLILGSMLDLSYTLNRTAEFGSEHSSAYIRYIAPLRLLGQTMLDHGWSAWVGHGPGSIFREPRVNFEFHDPTWAKLLYEYGVFGFVSFVLLTLIALSNSSVPIQIRAVLFLYWLLMGGHLLSPESTGLILFLVGFMPPAGNAEQPARRIESAF